mgnify:CR=1 FL=1
MEIQHKTQCGYVAILGRPNVGKSTLLNKLLGQKLSITSDKPQTTRHQILGIKTKNNVQAIYIDTPGLHQDTKKAVNRMMNRAASSVIHDVDVIIFMLDARYWTLEDEWIAKKLEGSTKTLLVALNKIDLLKDKETLLPLLDQLSKQFPHAEFIPLSVTKNQNVDELEAWVNQHLPIHPYIFSENQLTDRDDKFRIAEVVREKIMRGSGQEVPYETAVTVESVKMKDNVLHIEVIIWVERRGQKLILLGKKGERMKEIGKLARLDLEKIFVTKVFLRLWIKVKKGWSDDEKSLSQLGMG